MVDSGRRLTLGQIGGAVAGAIALGSATATAQPSGAKRPELQSPMRGGRQPVPLPFDPAKLKGLSERLLRSHWDNNYVGSVRALNMISERLAAAMKDPELPPVVYGGLKREELHRLGSVVLHEHYFGNLGGDGRPAGPIVDALKLAFGSVEAWEAEFRRTALALAGGSGWCVLTYNALTQELRNQWAWDHMHGAIGAMPLLVLDMYEHSYHMDYGAAAAQYVDAFLRNVRWEAVDVRFSAAIAPRR